MTPLHPGRLGHCWPVTSGDDHVGQLLHFPASKMLGHLRSGPSGLHLDGFAAALKRQGYTDDTAVRYVRAAAHLGHVLAGHGGLPRDIDLQAFSEHLRTCRCPRAKGGRHNHHTIYGARLFRRYLVEIGVCRPAAAAATPVEPSLITSFKAWLRRHRGASDATIRLYARDVARLLMALADDPATWDAAAVRTTFMDLASTSGRGTIEKMTTSLRAFLRYLAVEGRGPVSTVRFPPTPIGGLPTCHGIWRQNR